MNAITRILLLAILGLLTGCDPKVSEKDLSFLATQKKPLTADTVFSQLGQVEIGPGAYSYHFRGTNKVVEFWISPPPLPSQTSAKSIPVEIALVTISAEGAKREIIWPEDLKGKDYDEAIGALWPQKRCVVFFMAQPPKDGKDRSAVGAGDEVFGVIARRVLSIRG